MDSLATALQEIMQNVRKNKGHKTTSSNYDQETEGTSYKCPKCKDQLVVVDFENNIAKDCSCKKQRKIEKLMKFSNMSKEFQEKKFKNFDVEWSNDPRIVNAYETAMNYAKNFFEIKDTGDNSLGLVGNSGSGKSHLTSAVGNYLIKKGVEVVYFNFVNGFKEMFSLYDKADGKAKVQDVRELLHTCEVLIIDDIGKGKTDEYLGYPPVTKAVYDEMYGIIEARYYKNKPIIYSSEFYQELIAMLGEATASRLLERSKSHIATIFKDEGEQKGILNYRLREMLGR